MARFSFAIFGQTTSELMSNLDVKIKDSNNSVVANLSGSATYTLEDNQDGTYFVDNLPSGIYSVFIGNSPQDELTNIFFPTEDINTHINDATKHRVINDGTTTSTNLWSGSKINTQLNTKANTNHNHNGVYSLINHNHEGDYVEEGGDGVVIGTNGNKMTASLDAHSDDFEFVSGKLRVKQDFTATNFINGDNKLNVNIGALDQKIKELQDSLNSVTGVTAFTQYRQVYTDLKRANVGTGDEAGTFPEYTETNNATTFKTKVRFTFTKKDGDTKLICNFKGKGSGNSGSN